MNILFVLGSYPSFGGTEKVTTILANSFACQGYCVHIASFEQKDMELIDELSPKVKFHKLSHCVMSIKNIYIVRKLLIDNSIDILINQWCLPYHVSFMLNIARKGLRCKLISVLHGVPNRSKKVICAEDCYKKAKGILAKILAKQKIHIYNTIIRKSIKLTYGNSDAYVVLSKEFINTFKEYTGLNNVEKLYAIGNPITISVDYSTNHMEMKKKQILYVGRMDMENKRVNRIIETWETIYKTYRDWELVLVGDGPHKKQLEEYVRIRSIERVTFTGFLKEEPTHFYKDASIFMLTSDLEGFGLVIIEAMSYGVVPIVYGSYASVYDIIKDKTDGFITPMPFSIEITTAKLVELIENESLRCEMAQHAIIKSQKYSVESVIKEWEKLFSFLTR